MLKKEIQSKDLNNMKPLQVQKKYNIGMRNNPLNYWLFAMSYQVTENQKRNKITKLVKERIGKTIEILV